MDDVELDEHGRSGRLSDVEDACDGTIDPDDLSSACRLSLYAVRSQLHFRGLLHDGWCSALKLNRELPLEGAPGSREGYEDERNQGQPRTRATHSAGQSIGRGRRSPE